MRVRRGLYETVQRGVDPDHAPVDPHLVTTKLADDAVVAYHAALRLHGKACSVWRRFHHSPGSPVAPRGDRLPARRELRGHRRARARRPWARRGKLAALFSHNASRDLFDARELLRRGDLDRTRLRLGIVVYGGINRRDWREVSLDDVSADPAEADGLLVPMLRGDVAPVRDQVGEWSAQVVAECTDVPSVVLPLEPNECDFLDRLNGGGEIVPEMLTNDPALQDRIRTHPGLPWKALDVRKHIGSAGNDTT